MVKEVKLCKFNKPALDAAIKAAKKSGITANEYIRRALDEKLARDAAAQRIGKQIKEAIE